MTESTANKTQVGGSHYLAEYQHWDWVTDIRMGYLEGNATKYLSRWRKKNGREDLLKARHYVIKLIERVGDGLERQGCGDQYPGLFSRFIEAQGITDAHEIEALFLLSSWKDAYDLRGALDCIDRLREKLDAAAPVGD